MQQCYTLKPVNTPAYVHVINENCMQHRLCKETESQSVKKPATFVKPAGSFQCLQEHNYDHYPEEYEASEHPHPIYFRLTLILSSHLHLGPLSSLFPSELLTKILHTSHKSSACYMADPYHPLYFTILIIFGEGYK